MCVPTYDINIVYQCQGHFQVKDITGSICGFSSMTKRAVDLRPNAFLLYYNSSGTKELTVEAEKKIELDQLLETARSTLQKLEDMFSQNVEINPYAVHCYRYCTLNRTK